MLQHTLRILFHASALVASVAGVLLVGCSAPSDVDIQATPGGVRIGYKLTGSGPLPSGWTPSGMSTQCFSVDGNQYCTTVCIATNSNEPNCVYINIDGSCDPNSGGWKLYCQQVSEEYGKSLTSLCSGTLSDAGSVNYDFATGTVDAELALPCDTPIDSHLVDVFIAHPTTPATFLTASQFVAQYGTTAPAGAIIALTADEDTAAWDAYLLYLDTIVYDTTTGEHVAMVITEEQLGAFTVPFCATFVDGQLADLRVISEP